MKIELGGKQKFVDGDFSRIIFIDNDDSTRAADIELVHCFKNDSDRLFMVSLYKEGLMSIYNIPIKSWQKAKNLALLWVEG